MNDISMNSSEAIISEDAQELDARVRALLASPLDRVFESGRILSQITEGHHYRALGFASFDKYLASLKPASRRSTAYSNMRIAEKFDMDKHAGLGIARLRILASADFADPLALIAHGVEVSDGNGGSVRTPIKDITCRDLKLALTELRKQLVLAPTHGRSRSNAEPASTELSEAMLGAAEVLVSGLRDTESASGNYIAEIDASSSEPETPASSVSKGSWITSIVDDDPDPGFEPAVQDPVEDDDTENFYGGLFATQNGAPTSEIMARCPTPVRSGDHAGIRPATGVAS